ncbi:unknown [Helicoverpa armigera nucleopolyhedrovirus]|uniref:Uncharacterized protein n=1 Tax=Helicoverpa armigera nucleopolyhedrovirus TaxID=51313 RepID=Q99H39_9ABAC|nr:hypothetical protein HanGV4gp007 [Helicoverpa armigera nucleopolyhedrovirus G4]AAG53750.1 unknown [Helicoverpa armigera nucleopolyhedrovirus G4]
MYQTFFKTLVACCEPLTKLNSIINLSTYIVYSAGYCQCHRMYVCAICTHEKCLNCV